MTTIYSSLEKLIQRFHASKHGLDKGVSLEAEYSTRVDIQRKNAFKSTYSYVLQDVRVNQASGTHLARNELDDEQSYQMQALLSLFSSYEATGTKDDIHEKMIRDLHCFFLLPKELKNIEGVNYFEMHCSGSRLQVFNTGHPTHIWSHFPVLAYYKQDCSTDAICTELQGVCLDINDIATGVERTRGDFGDDFNMDFGNQTDG